MPGWKEPLDGARTMEALPPAAREYVALIEREVGVAVTTVSVGAGREQTIVLRGPFDAARR